MPNYLFDPDTFDFGSRNGVFTTGVEHKMGIESSPTCELTFGATDVPAVGYLVGGVHNGIAQMFTTHRARPHDDRRQGRRHAVHRLPERFGLRQGARTRRGLTQMTDKMAPRVTIMHHPDVRRSLMTQKAYAEVCARCTCMPPRIKTMMSHNGFWAPTTTWHRVDDLLLPSSRV